MQQHLTTLPVKIILIISNHQIEEEEKTHLVGLTSGGGDEPSTQAPKSKLRDGSKPGLAVVGLLLPFFFFLEIGLVPGSGGAGGMGESIGPLPDAAAAAAARLLVEKTYAAHTLMRCFR